MLFFCKERERISQHENILVRILKLHLRLFNWICLVEEVNGNIKRNSKQETYLFKCNSDSSSININIKHEHKIYGINKSAYLEFLLKFNNVLKYCCQGIQEIKTTWELGEKKT